jgi:hypothetical protein
LARRTEGASGAFIRELMRRAAHYAIRAGGSVAVETEHLDDALRELLVDGGEFTKTILGFRPS